MLTPSGDPVIVSECASISNSTFVAQFLDVLSTTLPSLQQYHYLPINPIFINSNGIVSEIDNLKVSCSSGSDTINSKFLKNSKEYSSIRLSKIFQ